MNKFDKIYNTILEDIKLKKRLTPIKVVKVKSKKGEDITISVRPSKNNYLEYSIETTDKKTHNNHVYEKRVYNKNEVYTYLNDIIKPQDKEKLNDLPSIGDKNDK